MRFCKTTLHYRLTKRIFDNISLRDICYTYGYQCISSSLIFLTVLFIVLQWSDNRVFFLVYRLLMALNSLGWTVAYYEFCKRHCRYRYERSYQYITLWADFLRTSYFVLSALLLCITFRKRLPVAEENGKDLLNT